MARPTKFNDARTGDLLTALKAGNTRKAAAAYAGIGFTTFLRWLEKHPSFAAQVAKAEADCEVRNVAIVQKAAGERWQAAAWWLERRRHEQWKRRESIDVRDLTDEQIIALLNRSAEEGGTTEGPDGPG